MSLSKVEHHDEPAPAIGRHVVLDLYGVTEARMADADRATDRLRESLTDCGFHVLHDCRHSFPGGGATGLVLLSESHASFHTYPELGYVAFDVFGCGAADVDRLIDQVLAIWEPQRVVRHELCRGGETST